jgi:hypothetical protein
MNKVPGVIPLIMQANYQIKHMSVHLIRAESNFLVKESLDMALKQLSNTIKILEQAKMKYVESRPE